MDFSYLDYKLNEQYIPNEQYNSGLYVGDETWLKKPWGSRSVMHHIPPDAAEYCKYFYAKEHIPSYQTRPGNNTIDSQLLISYSNKNYHLNCIN